MLTVKHISDVGGEAIYTAHHVEFRPAASKQQGPALDTVIAFNEPHHVVAEFGSGNIYVMNAAGATVSSYALGSAASLKAA